MQVPFATRIPAAPVSIGLRICASSFDIYVFCSTFLLLCRPGDVIWMAPQVHELLEPLRISHPLHLLGGGSMPDQTVLSSPKGATATLELRCALDHTHMHACIFSMAPV